MYQPIRNRDFTLRPFESADAVELSALVDRNRARLREWLPWLDKNTNAEDSACFIAHCLSTQKINGAPTLGIWSEGKLRGTIGFHPVDHANRRASLGYWIGAESSGRGLVTKAAKELLKYGFEYLALERIELRCATGNHASRRVAERLGFRHEGTLRRAEWLYDHFVDHDLFSLLREEWSEGDSSAAQSSSG